MKFQLRYIFFCFFGKGWVVQTLKRENIGYQDLLEESLGWFLGFPFIMSVLLSSNQCKVFSLQPSEHFLYHVSFGSEEHCLYCLSYFPEITVCSVCLSVLRALPAVCVWLYCNHCLQCLCCCCKITATLFLGSSADTTCRSFESQGIHSYRHPTKPGALCLF